MKNLKKVFIDNQLNIYQKRKGLFIFIEKIKDILTIENINDLKIFRGF